MLVDSLALTPARLAFGSYTYHPMRQAYDAKYRLIRDCLNNNVKAQKTTYLPDPSELREDEGIKKHRYDYYWQRAQWLPATKRTQQALVAQVFTHKPRTNYDGLERDFIIAPSINGDSMIGFANYSLSENVGMGRGAIVVWNTGNDKPVLDFIEAEHITSWADLPYGAVDDIGRNIGSVVVRTFSATLQSDDVTIDFTSKLTQFRLDAQGKAWIRTLYEVGLGQSSGWSSWSKVIVRGNHIGHIPVFILGAERNILAVQPSPIEELAELNISHYICSADYQEHAKLAGQVTTVLSGLKQDWYDKNINGKLAFGVRRPIPLNEGAKASLLQAQANSVSKEALDKTESMMVSVGARLIEQRQVRRTATEADIEAQSYHSILGHIAVNTSDALTLALRHVSLHYGATSMTESTAAITLNNDFSSVNTSPEHRRLLLEEYIAGVRTFEEYRNTLRKYDDTVGTDDAEAKKQIEADIDLRTKLANISTKPQTGGDNRTQSNPNEE